MIFGNKGFVVKLEKHIEDEVVYGDLKFKIASYTEHIKNAVKQGFIYALPLGFDVPNIEVGCKIVFDPIVSSQHNKKGVFHKSKFMIDEDNILYFLPCNDDVNLAFAVKDTNGHWVNIGSHDILSPIKQETIEKMPSGVFKVNVVYENYQEGAGVMLYPTETSKAKGFVKGEKCFFKKGIEWLIELDGQKHYAIRSQYMIATETTMKQITP